MHIVRVSHLFYPDIVSDYLFELSMKQAEMGHRVDVLTWNKSNRSPREIIANDFVIYRLSGVNFSLGDSVVDYPYLPSLPSKIDELNPQIIHAESHLFLTTIHAIKEGKKLGVPSIVTVHGVMVERGLMVNLAQHSYMHTLGRWIFKNVNRIICLTKSDALKIIKYGCPAEKIRIIPNAVDTNRFKPTNKSREDLVVWTGRFVPEKGLEYLIEAAKIVVKRFKKNVKFMLVGYGPLKEKIMSLTHNCGLSNNSVYFLGPFDRDRVSRILSKAGIFVFPSLKEGLPISLLEALACGKPVVASNIPGINDVISNGENGLLVPPKDPEALANAILTLLDDENMRKRLGKKARRLIEERYSWNTVISHIEKVYHELLR